jgi:hypothetical protein
MSKRPQHKRIHGDSGEKPHTPTDQAKAFRKAARELGCDESEDRFQGALRIIAKAKPQPQSPSKRRTKS